MLTLEELAGIVEVMAILSEEEIIEIAQELSFMRDEAAPEVEDIRTLIGSGLKKHWLERIEKKAVCTGVNGSIFYIAGPSSFGLVPPELSEIMEIIEFEGCRSFDWEMVTSDIVTDLSRRLGRLESLVEDAADGIISLEKAEQQYSDLFNLYYDYDFWLPVGLPGISAGLETISSRLTGLKEQ